MCHTIGRLDEAGLLQRIFPRLPGATLAHLGPGDDAAVLATRDGRMVITIDTVVENLDFRLIRGNGHVTTGFDVGWKAAAQNLSDINAMGARATSLLVSLTLPSETPVAWVEDLADGISAAIDQLGAAGCGVIGGDLGGGRDISVTIAATGSLEDREPVLRSRAKVGDEVAVAGTVGQSAAGLALMESERRAESLDPDLMRLVRVQRRPRPPLDAGPAASVAGARSMLDISDGLLRDAGRIATASGVSIRLDPKAVARLSTPLRKAAALLEVDPIEWALSGGEDYGLLATFPFGTRLPPQFTAIGVVVRGNGGVDVGSLDHISAGWDHFSD